MPLKQRLRWWCPRCGSRDPDHKIRGETCEMLGRSEYQAFENGDGQRTAKTPSLEDYDNGAVKGESE